MRPEDIHREEMDERVKVLENTVDFLARCVKKLLWDQYAVVGENGQKEMPDKGYAQDLYWQCDRAMDGMTVKHQGNQNVHEREGEERARANRIARQKAIEASKSNQRKVDEMRQMRWRDTQAWKNRK